MPDDGKEGTTERCRECWYHGWLDSHACSGDVCCDYLLVEGKRPPNLIRRKYRNWELAQ